MDKYADDRFIDENINAQKDWDVYICNKLLLEAEKLGIEKNDPFYIETQNLIEGLIKENEKECEEYGYSKSLGFSNDRLFNQIFERFVEIAEEETSSQLRSFYIGKLDKTDLNAEAHPIINGSKGYLITFNNELDFKLLVLANIVADKMCLTLTDDRYFSERIDAKIKILAGTSKSFFSEADIKPAHKKMHSDFSIKLYEGALSFVIAHEIGHHLLKHTETSKNMMLNNLPQIVPLNTDHAKEFAADKFAVELMIKYYSKNNKRYSPTYMMAPLFVLLVFALQQDPEKYSDTHPAVKERYKNLLLTLKENCSEFDIFTMIYTFEQLALKINHNNKKQENIWWK